MTMLQIPTPTAPNDNMDAAWITLMDYAMKKGVSLSTLRRHIKAQKIQFKVEEGRYLIWDPDFQNENVSKTGSERLPKAIPEVLPEILPEALIERVSFLSRELKNAREEIAELKTLIAFYEEKNPQSHPRT